MELKGVIRSVSRLSSGQTRDMLAMMAQNYDNVQPEIFYDDLREKNIVIMVHGPNGELKGFSTQEIFKHRVGDHVFRVIFTGDTIVNPSSWGSMEFPITLMKWMLAVWKEEPSVPLLWMLICKGMRTYRFLPLFFHTFLKILKFRSFLSQSTQ